MTQADHATSNRMILVSMGDIEASGCRCLRAYLKDKGIDTEVIFFKDRGGNEVPDISDGDIDTLVNTIREKNPALVGLSLFSFMSNDAARITRRLQDELNLFVLWGGIHAIVEPEESLRIADAVCIGEGEEALVDFFQRFVGDGNYEETPGFWVRRDNQIHKNEYRLLIQDLDTIPMSDYEDEGKTFIRNDGTVYVGEPFFDGTGRSSYFQSNYFIQAARGCPYDCAYCTESALKKLKTKGHKYFRTKSISRTIDELLYAKKKFPKLRDIGFRDEVFAYSGENLVTFAKEYKEKIGLPFRTSLYPRQLTEERIRVMAAAGLYELHTGIQSGSYRVRKEEFDRGISDETLLAIADIAKATGIRTVYDIIVDNPWEKEEDRDESIEFMLKLPLPLELRVFSLCHFPQTRLTIRALEEGIITADEIEGHDDKSRKNWRTILNKKKSSEEVHWNLTLTLLSKSFIPRRLIRHIYYSGFWRTHLGLLEFFVKGTNTLKTVARGISYVFQGKINAEYAVYLLTHWRSAINVNR